MYFHIKVDFLYIWHKILDDNMDLTVAPEIYAVSLCYICLSFIKINFVGEICKYKRTLCFIYIKFDY